MEMIMLMKMIESVWDMLNEMSPYLLLGFLIAGLMHAFVPGGWFRKYLAGRKFSSVVNAALFGIPLPLCSCGVIPTAMSLRKEGASKGAAVSFLIATPQTGVDSILATYSLLGLPFAIIRPIAALVTALVGGEMVNLLTESVNSEQLIVNSEQLIVNSEQLTVNSEGNTSSFHIKLLEALKYAFVEMMEDIGKWLVVGIVVAGLIALIPNEYFAVFKDNTLASILLVLCLSIPMYLCATGSIPIAVALMLKGLTPGAALVLLMAGPASNIASILVIGKVLGRRTLITYLASIIGGAIAFALLIDFCLPQEWFLLPMTMTDACCHEETNWLSIGCSILLILMLANAFVRGHHHQEADPHQPSLKGRESISSECSDLTTLKIKGMCCNHCATNLQKSLAQVEGVEEATVDLKSDSATIKGTASLDDLRKAVEEMGYAVREQ